MRIIKEEEIKELIGETTDYDKKLMLEEKDTRSWMKSISAFANGVGGTLIYGIEDKTDEVIGMPNAEQDADKIGRFIRSKMDPVPRFALRFANVDGKKLILVEVYPGEETPYYYVGKNDRTAYWRSGNDSVPCESSKLRELTLKGSGKSYDSVSSGYKISDMAFTKLKSVYFQRTNTEFQDSDFESFGLVDKDDILTNAGALLADESPIRHSRLFCTRWNGLTMASSRQDALDDAEYSGSLVSLLQEGLAFVKRNSRKAWYKEGDRRVEQPDYPERPVIEGIVNALIHRNYLEVGSEVHIDMYDDRIEIYSPGGMYDGIKVQDRDIMNVPSRRRNPIIADVFQRMIYMERRGSGFKKIIGDYKKQVNYTEDSAPVFKSEYDAFFLTLKNLNYRLSEKGDKKGDKKGDSKAIKKGDEIARRVEDVYELIASDNTISIPEIMEKLSITKKQTETAIRKLKESGRLSREGKTSGGRWVTK